MNNILTTVRNIIYQYDLIQNNPRLDNSELWQQLGESLKSLIPVSMDELPNDRLAELQKMVSGHIINREKNVSSRIMELLTNTRGNFDKKTVQEFYNLILQHIDDTAEKKFVNSLKPIPAADALRIKEKLLLLYYSEMLDSITYRLTTRRDQARFIGMISGEKSESVRQVLIYIEDKKSEKSPHTTKALENVNDKLRQLGINSSELTNLLSMRYEGEKPK
jgi:hypothetical protein